MTAYDFIQSTDDDQGLREERHAAHCLLLRLDLRQDIDVNEDDEQRADEQRDQHVHSGLQLILTKMKKNPA